MKYNLNDMWRVPALSSVGKTGVTWEELGKLIRDSEAQRAVWWPPASAWEMLARLHEILDKRVKVRFSRPRMNGDVEWSEPNPAIATCDAFYTSMIEGYPQPFLVVSDVLEIDMGRKSCQPYIVAKSGMGTFIRLAEVRQLEILDSVTSTPS